MAATTPTRCQGVCRARGRRHVFQLPKCC